MGAPWPRQPLLDALRAIALVSVLVVNAVGYAVAPWGPMLGLRLPADSAWAAAAQGLVGALLQGKGYAMLAFLFGMSLWLAARRYARPEALRLGRRRQRRLLQLGVLHGAFIYCGDILTLYALVGRLLLGRLHLPWRALRRHLWRALAWALAGKLVLALLVLGLPILPAVADEATLSSVHGGWPFLALNAGAYVYSQFVGLVVAGPVIYLCMACGVAAARLRLLTHRRWRAALGRFLRRSGPLLLAGSLAYGWGCATTGPADASRPWIDTLGDLIAVPVAACYLAALALASDGGHARWCRWLAPLGQRSLTLYIGYGLLCLVLFSGAGWAIETTSVQIVLFGIGVWLLAWMAALGSGARRWPMEAWMARR